MADTKSLVRQLQRNPSDQALLRSLKKQMLSERRLTGLAQVIEWWAKRAPNRQMAAQELYEVGVALEGRARYKDRALELYDLALTYQPEHAAAQARIAVLRPDEELDALLDALDGDSIHPPPGKASAPPRPGTPTAPTVGTDAPGAPGPKATGAPRPSRPSGLARGSIPSLAAHDRGSSRPPYPPQQGPRSSIPSLRSTTPPKSAAPRPSGSSFTGGAAPALADPEPPPISSPLPPVPRPPPISAPAPRVSTPRPPPRSSSGPAGRMIDDVDEELETSPQQRRVPKADAAPGPSSPASGRARGFSPSDRVVRAGATSAPPDGYEPALYADEDEDEEDSPGSGARFAVRAILAEPPPGTGKAPHGAPRLEVVRSRGDAVLGIGQVRMWGSGGGSRLRARRMGLRAFKVRPPEGATGSRQPVGGPAVPIGTESFRMEPGDVAELTADGVVHRLRVVTLSKPPLAAARQLHVKRYAGAVAGGLLIHLIGVLAVVLMHSQGVTFVVDDRPREEIFAEAKLAPPPEEKKRTIRKPKPIKLRKRPKPDKPAPSEERAKIPNSMRKKLNKIARSRARSSKNSVDRLVSALTSPHAGEGKSVKEVVSNIEAVKGGEKSAAFRVGGTLAGIEGVGPNIASGGGGEVGTLGGKEATGSLARLTGPKRKVGVRGKVATVSALAKVQGSLSRSEVLKVLNANQRKVVRCYERALTATPNLSGKLTFTWTIKPTGRVGSVRESASTLGDKGVSKCIAGVIKRMKFPKPKGGSVSITFPWIFTRAR